MKTTYEIHIFHASGFIDILDEGILWFDTEQEAKSHIFNMTEDYKTWILGEDYKEFEFKVARLDYTYV